jgi:hypothetical protein
MSTALLMRQPIAGVAPPKLGEATIMTVWPSLAATSIGRSLGQLYAIGGGSPPFTLGHLIALLSIPLVVPLYFHKLVAAVLPGLPGAAQRYVLTNRRVVIRAGLRPLDVRWVELDRFDSITVVVRPGEAWYHAGDLVFKLGQIETFRLDGVVRPEVFRHICMSARQGYLGVL